MLSVELSDFGGSLSPVRSEAPYTPYLPAPEPVSRPGSAEKKHDFVRTHLQGSSQCEFCGKKVGATAGSSEVPVLQVDEVTQGGFKIIVM